MRIPRSIQNIADRWQGRWYAVFVGSDHVNLVVRNNGEEEIALMPQGRGWVLWSMTQWRVIRRYPSLTAFARDLERWIDRPDPQTGLVILD